MNSLNLSVFSLHKCKSLIAFLFVLIFLLLTGCSSQTDDKDENKSTSNNVKIPGSIQTLALPDNTTSFTANLYLNDESTPFASESVATDGSQNTVAFSDIAVPVGTHNFTLTFELKTPSYEIILASALSDTIIIAAGSSQTINFDISNYDFDYDFDTDLVSNFDEVEAGTPPDDDICVIGISLIGHCSLGA